MRLNKFKNLLFGFFAILFLTACHTAPQPSNPSLTSDLRSSAKTDSIAIITQQQMADAAENNIKIGLYYLEQKNIPLAKEKLLLALSQNPDNFMTHDAMAYFLEMTQEIQKAEKYYLRAIALTPKTGAAHNNYGTFLYRQHRCREALIQFMTTINDAKYLQVAAVYENAGFAALCSNEVADQQQAKIYFSKALAIEPQRVKSQKALQNLLK